MKKLFLFLSIFLASLSFNSCTNDDDDDNIPNPSSDQVLGKWQMDQLFSNNVEQTLNVCDKTHTVEFFSSGAVTDKNFEENDASQCVALPVVNGTWKNMGNSMYRFTNMAISDVKCTFQTNKMTFEFSRIVNGVTSTEKGIFIKVTS